MYFLMMSVHAVLTCEILVWWNRRCIFRRNLPNLDFHIHRIQLYIFNYFAGNLSFMKKLNKRFWNIFNGFKKLFFHLLHLLVHGNHGNRSAMLPVVENSFCYCCFLGKYRLHCTTIKHCVIKPIVFMFWFCMWYCDHSAAVSTDF